MPGEVSAPGDYHISLIATVKRHSSWRTGRLVWLANEFTPRIKYSASCWHHHLSVRIQLSAAMWTSLIRHCSCKLRLWVYWDVTSAVDGEAEDVPGEVWILQSGCRVNFNINVNRTRRLTVPSRSSLVMTVVQRTYTICLAVPREHRLQICDVNSLVVTQ